MVMEDTRFSRRLNHNVNTISVRWHLADAVCFTDISEILTVSIFKAKWLPSGSCLLFAGNCFVESCPVGSGTEKMDLKRAGNYLENSGL